MVSGDAVLQGDQPNAEPDHNIYKLTVALIAAQRQTNASNLQFLIARVPCWRVNALLTDDGHSSALISTVLQNNFL
jgi:hypothetical protein